jgi:hypothetical protein
MVHRAIRATAAVGRRDAGRGRTGGGFLLSCRRSASPTGREPGRTGAATLTGFLPRTLTVTKLKIAILAAVVSGLSFIAGAYWVRAEIWPYRRVSEYLGRFESYARLTRIRHWSIQTDLAALDLMAYPLSSMVSIHASGGGIDTFDRSVLVMSFRGEFFVFQSLASGATVVRLPIVLDNGYDGFQAYMRRNHPTVVDAVEMFRFMDVIYDRESSPPRLLVSHHRWHEAAGCYSMQLSELRLDPAPPRTGARSTRPVPA